MTKQQRENLNELWSTLEELAGDIIAIQNFLECKENCVDNFGREVCSVYLRRIGDYADNHTHDIRQLKDSLVIPALKEIYPE